MNEPTVMPDASPVVDALAQIDSISLDDVAKQLHSQNPIFKKPWFRVLAGFVLVVAGVWLVLVGGVVTGRLPNYAATFVYANETFYPPKAVICQGEPLKYSVTSTVVRAPAVVSFVYTMYSVEQDATLFNVPNELKIIYLEQDLGRTLTNTITYTDTARLAPGHYQYRRLAQEQNSNPNTYFVPFEVKACP